MSIVIEEYGLKVTEKKSKVVCINGMQNKKFKYIWPMFDASTLLMPYDICNCLTLLYDHAAPQILIPNIDLEIVSSLLNLSMLQIKPRRHHRATFQSLQ